MVLFQQLKTISEKFNINVTVDFSAREKTFLLTPIDKDGEAQKQVGVKMDDKFYTLKTKHRDLYLVLLVAKILHHVDQRIYDHYTFSYYSEDQYVNLLLLSLSKSEQDLNSVKDNRDLFDKTIKMSIVNSSIISRFDLRIDVKKIELILSDDLYRYIGYSVTNRPIKGLQKPEEKTLLGYPLKISVNKDSNIDFFTFKINGFKVYEHITMLNMKPAFYLPLHIFEPITCKRHFESVYRNDELLKKGYTLLNYQGFIQLAFKRIFEAIDLLNSGEDLVSPMWIRNHHKSLSLPFAKNLLSLNYSTRKCIA
jgi:hypothetical protein